MEEQQNYNIQEELNIFQSQLKTIKSSFQKKIHQLKHSIEERKLRKIRKEIKS